MGIHTLTDSTLFKSSAFSLSSLRNPVTTVNEVVPGTADAHMGALFISIYYNQLSKMAIFVEKNCVDGLILKRQALTNSTLRAQQFFRIAKQVKLFNGVGCFPPMT
mgnify:CR=1 FL=1